MKLKFFKMYVQKFTSTVVFMEVLIYRIYNKKIDDKQIPLEIEG